MDIGKVIDVVVLERILVEELVMFLGEGVAKNFFERGFEISLYENQTLGKVFELFSLKLLQNEIIFLRRGVLTPKTLPWLRPWI